MTKMMMTAMAAAAMLMTSPAVAGPVEVRVSTDNIDLTSAEGRAELAKRARHAAIDACGTRSAVDRKSAKAIKTCRAEVAENVRRAAARSRLAQQ